MATTLTAPAALQFENQLFIDGKFVDAVKGGRIAVLNPHDNSTITEIAEATAEDVDVAVIAARKAFPASASSITAATSPRVV